METPFKRLCRLTLLARLGRRVYNDVMRAKAAMINQAWLALITLLSQLYFFNQFLPFNSCSQPWRSAYSCALHSLALDT